MRLKPVRLFLWSLVAILVVALGADYFLQPKIGNLIPYAATGLADESGDIGGAFTMTDQHGAAFTEKNLAGKPSLMFFGFTACPDVCPTTLADMTAWLKKLGHAADKLNVIFVTVDPERDTAAQLANYLSLFDPRITGLTGTPEQLAEMAKAYRIYYKKVPVGKDNYTMDHTASIYLLNAEAKLVGTIAYHENENIAFGKIRRLAAK